MKVSRKVGRRSRSSSSVSRRRLRNKNRKHTKTQKGGKHGKRGRGHKRVRTYKHGRRFHRGGKDWPMFGEPEPASFVADPRTTPTTPSTRGNIYNLKYIMSTTDGDSIKDKNKYDNFLLQVLYDDEREPFCKLEKTDGKSKFSFIIGPYDNLEQLAEQVSIKIKNGSNFENVAFTSQSPTSYRFIADEELANAISHFIRYCNVA